MKENISTEASFLNQALNSRVPELIAATRSVYFDKVRRGHAVEAAILLVAAKFGEISLIRELLEYRVDVDFADCNGETALFIAIKNDQADTVAYLLTVAKAEFLSKNKNTETVFHIAAMLGNTACLKLLLDMINTTKRMNHDFDTLAWIDCPSSTGETPLLLAAQYGNETAVRLLINQGACVNITHPQLISALYQLALKGKANDVAYLLERGAKSHAGLTLDYKNIFTKLIRKFTVDHETSTAVFQILLNFGAGIGITIPDALFDYAIDWRNVCLIGATFDREKVFLKSPKNFNQACANKRTFYQLRNSINKNILIGWRTHCEYMASLHPHNNELQEFLIALRVTQDTLAMLCKNVLQTSATAQGRISQYALELRNLENDLNEVDVGEPVINALRDVKKSNKGNPWEGLNNSDRKTLMQILRYQYLTSALQTLGISFSDISSGIFEDNQKPLSEIQTVQYMKNTDMHRLEERINQLNKFLAYIEEHLNRSARSCDNDVDAMCFGYRLICVASACLLSVLGIILVTHNNLTAGVFVLAIALWMLVTLYPACIIGNYFSQDLVHQRLLTLSNISMIGFQEQACLDALLSLINSAEYLTLDGFPETAMKLTSNSKLGNIIPAINDLIQFENNRKLELQRLDPILNYPKQSQVQNLQFFPPAPKKPAHVAIAINDDISSESTPLLIAPSSSSVMAAAAAAII